MSLNNEFLKSKSLILLIKENSSTLRFFKVSFLSKYEINPLWPDNKLNRKYNNKNVKTNISEFKRDILAVPNTINLFVLFNRLIEKKEHISIVVDEYGGLDGIITMEDVIETFLGLEIMDESDQVVDMQKYAKQKWIQKNTK